MDDDQLLLRIARCPELRSAVEPSHPCHEIVGFQEREEIVPRQVPTPWIGHLSEAPILFIGSNPNITGTEDYPATDWADDLIIDHFDNAFSGEYRRWIRNGVQVLNRDGTYGDWVRTWAAARKRAEELLERPPIPGTDYAMTEIVHCRSWKEIGVESARNYCAEQYFERILAASAARVCIAFGAQPRRFFAKHYSLTDSLGLARPVDIGGHPRSFVFLAHPTSFGSSKTLAQVLSGAELALLRRSLAN